MKRSQWALIVLLGAMVLQAVVPVLMIVRRETALRKGEVYRFKTAPVDPHDAFRGRYVALNYEQARRPRNLAPDAQRREKLFAVLGTDHDGFAVIEELVRKRPDDRAWIPVRVRWTGDPLNLALPFDRYYMNEKDAPRAERKAGELGRNGDPRTSYAEVKILNGFPVIHRLIVDSKPIEDHLQ